jgi:hypothetical protein
MATVQVIRKNKRDALGDTLGVLGQGLAGFGSGYLGGQRMNMMKDNNEQMRKLLERMFGANGAGIQTPSSTPFGAAVDTVNAGVGIPAQNTPDLSSLMPMLDLSAWR